MRVSVVAIIAAILPSLTPGCGQPSHSSDASPSQTVTLSASAAPETTPTLPLLGMTRAKGFSVHRPESATTAPQFMLYGESPSVCWFSVDVLQVSCREIAGASDYGARLVPAVNGTRWVLRSPHDAVDKDVATDAFLRFDGLTAEVSYKPRNANSAWASVDGAGRVRLLDGDVIARSLDGRVWERSPLPALPERGALTLLGDWLLFQDGWWEAGPKPMPLTARRVGALGQPLLGPELSPGMVPSEIAASCWTDGGLAALFACTDCAHSRLGLFSDAGASLHDIGPGYPALSCTKEGATLTYLRHPPRTSSPPPTGPPDRGVTVEQQRCTTLGCISSVAELRLPLQFRGWDYTEVDVSSVPFGNRTLLVWLGQESALERAQPYMRLAPLEELALASDIPLVGEEGLHLRFASVNAFVSGAYAVVVLFGRAKGFESSGGSPWGWEATVHAVRVSADGTVKPFTRVP
jgi:hypothetical protein